MHWTIRRIALKPKSMFATLTHLRFPYLRRIAQGASVAVLVLMMGCAPEQQADQKTPPAATNEAAAVDFGPPVPAYGMQRPPTYSRPPAGIGMSPGMH